MRTLVLCTWWDGGPDTENFAYKVLDENFNEVEIPSLEFDQIIDLYRNESRDEQGRVYWTIHEDLNENPFATKEMIDDAERSKAAWQRWRDYNGNCEEKFGGNWSWPTAANYNKECAEESERLWEEARDLEDKLKAKYNREQPITYTIHSIGVEEFCKMHGIDRVIRLH